MISHDIFYFKQLNQSSTSTKKFIKVSQINPTFLSFSRFLRSLPYLFFNIILPCSDPLCMKNNQCYNKQLSIEAGSTIMLLNGLQFHFEMLLLYMLEVGTPDMHNV